MKVILLIACALGAAALPVDLKSGSGGRTVVHFDRNKSVSRPLLEREPIDLSLGSGRAPLDFYTNTAVNKKIASLEDIDKYSDGSTTGHFDENDTCEPTPRSSAKLLACMSRQEA